VKVKANHHLYLRSNVWWVRLERNGRTLRQSTGFRKSDVVDARKVWDALATRNARASRGIEELPEAVSIGKLIELYLAEQSQPYDRTRNGALQPGTKKVQPVIGSSSNGCGKRGSTSGCAPIYSTRR
jgi:hypothetical protein